MGASYNGSTTVSKTVSVGSIPTAPANHFYMDKIDYKSIIEKYPWLIQKDMKCVISPDADGMLCGLFMSNYLNWEIVGYYDNGKNLILKNGIRAEDCIFLDTEIYRSDIRSTGHHISLFRKNNTLVDINNYRNCLNPNNLRGRTLKENFSLKYPMGTVHLLLCIVGEKIEINCPAGSFFVILQADGTINRFLDKYSENLYDWLLYLGIEDSQNTLNKIIRKEINLIDICKDYVDYIKQYVKGKKDKIPISERGVIKDLSFNLEKTSFSDVCKQSTKEYLGFLSENTGWVFNQPKWCFDGFRLYEFSKKIKKPGVGTFNAAVQENFLSLAITGNDKMEYTVEEPDKLP